ncbi:MAG: flagellar biosynthesis protein FlhB [Candidatus Pelagadaptatus aseana]|uniref:flagellar biosynthesis protein FlhB n=1 Tax=Candidatus Pelagadaptatus aseana TaxID=3120508 RepID=UPI0039B3340E
MAENDDSQEKTEEPTARRLEKAREEGQIPRSRELTTTAILLAGTVGLVVFGPFMAETLSNIIRFNFILERDAAFDTNLMISHLTDSMADGMIMLLPLFAILFLAAILGPIALGGWLWSTKAMAPKASRMNPLEGLKRMFGTKGLMELVKAVAKVLVILALAIVLLMSMQQDILELALMTPFPAVVESMKLSGWAAIALSAVTILIAMVDIPFQIHDNTKKLRISRQDIKDEMKDTEGKPEVKGRIRQLQREMANNRQLQSVPEADVVITNPTHFSVALKYDPATMETPIMVAKGVDHFALKIREVANEHDIQIMESPVLARAIYHTTDVDGEIPGGLYMAVAQVLAYVFQLRNYKQGVGEMPVYPRNIDVPKDMQYDP